MHKSKRFNSLKIEIKTPEMSVSLVFNKEQMSDSIQTQYNILTSLQ